MATGPGGRLAAGTHDGTVRLWAGPGGRVEHTLVGHTARTLGLAFSPDARLLATGGLDRTIRLWDTRTGRCEQVLPGHDGAVGGWLAFTPDGRTPASAGGDGTIGLWEPATGARTATLRPPGPYEGSVITGVTGITDAQRAALRALGALDER